MDNRPIGIFDSGVGGLTVYRAIKRRLPCEKMIYLGDTARIPYGTRSPSTVKRYAYQDAAFLVKQGVKLLVVACNTISSVALRLLQSSYDVPIVGVIEPGAKAAVRSTRNGRVGVIATEATVESRAYELAIKNLDAEVEVFSQACPLFVPLAEEGWLEHDATALIARHYLEPLIDAGVDTLVLGCTHYPLLRRTIQKIMGEEVMLLDSGECVAAEIGQVLKKTAEGEAAIEDDVFYVTDSGNRFRRIANLFLDNPIGRLIAVDIWEEKVQFDEGGLGLLQEAFRKG
ncbi:MAG: glutamate racemase [Acidobacteriota bacterium]|nr:glutamate racemase [Blastocatellia bacterium]MDW8412607.1 glutamate racemase [Acidobacteriota bacterium]